MKRLLLFFIMSATFAYGLFASDSLPFPVSVGGQAAKDGTPFAKIENPVAADAELSVQSKDAMIIVNVQCGECEERTGSRLNARGDFAAGQNQNEPRQNNGWKEARCRKLRRERGKRRQDCQYPRHHQVAFAARKRFFFAAIRRVSIETQLLFSRPCRPLDSGKASAITAATGAKFLTAASVSRGACAACGGFGCARNTATTFHVFYRLQVTNFSLLKSAPNGVNYIDIRRLFLHGRFRVSG